MDIKGEVTGSSLLGVQGSTDISLFIVTWKGGLSGEGREKLGCSHLFHVFLVFSYLLYLFFWCLLLLTTEKTLSKSQHHGGWQAMPFNNILWFTQGIILCSDCMWACSTGVQDGPHIWWRSYTTCGCGYLWRVLLTNTSTVLYQTCVFVCLWEVSLAE